MFQTISGYKRRYSLLFAVLLAMVMPICLSLGSNRTITGTKHQRATVGQRARAGGLRAASKTATAGATPSLEMKENVDFLLTPALLVQEALSDDIVITYPSE